MTAHDGACPRCHERTINPSFGLCDPCDQTYCFECGNDLPCERHQALRAAHIDGRAAGGSMDE